MSTINSLIHYYDTALIYYPNIFYSVLLFLLCILLYFLLKLFILLIKFIQNIRSYSHATGNKKNGFKKIHAFNTKYTAIQTTIEKRIHRLEQAFVKEVFINEK